MIDFAGERFAALPQLDIEMFNKSLPRYQLGLRHFGERLIGSITHISLLDRNVLPACFQVMFRPGCASKVDVKVLI
jgi:hypothetical protein